MKYVNQFLINAAQKMRLNIRNKKYSFVEKADLILKKDMEHKKNNKKKKNLESTV